MKGIWCALRCKIKKKKKIPWGNEVITIIWWVGVIRPERQSRPTTGRVSGMVQESYWIRVAVFKVNLTNLCRINYKRKHATERSHPV